MTKRRRPDSAPTINYGAMIAEKCVEQALAGSEVHARLLATIARMRAANGAEPHPIIEAYEAKRRGRLN